MEHSGFKVPSNWWVLDWEVQPIFLGPGSFGLLDLVQCYLHTRSIGSGTYCLSLVHNILPTALVTLYTSLVSSPAVIGTRFGISTFPHSEFLCGCTSGPYNVWCISPWKRTSVTSVTHIPFFGTPVTRHVYHSLTLQSRIIQCSMAYEMIYLLYYAK